jgi:rare lipoprotein A
MIKLIILSFLVWMLPFQNETLLKTVDNDNNSNDGVVVTAPVANTQTESSNNTSTEVEPLKTYNGIASFYSKNLENTLTSTGERFKHAGLTAASNHIALGNYVRVTHIKNGKSVIVRINDRMHPRMAARGRVVDLTITAFSSIGPLDAGLLKVKVEVLGKKKPN